MRKCEILKMEDNGAGKYEMTIKGTRYETYRSACAGRGKRRPEWNIFLPGSVAENLSVGDTIRVIKDGYNDLFDYIYLCNDKIVFAQKPVNTKQGYKDYIAQLPGFLPNGDIDRVVLRFALMRECRRRNLGVSLLSWRNLQRICKDDMLASIR